jgi:hypothetical protein
MLGKYPNIKFKISHSQKSISVYAKYLWCIGLISEPVFCPIDGIILRICGIEGAWTQVDDIEIHKGYIADVNNFLKNNTKFRSIAEFELCQFNQHN